MAAMEGDVALLKQMKIIKKGRNDANTELPDTVGGQWEKTTLQRCSRNPTRACTILLHLQLK